MWFRHLQNIVGRTVHGVGGLAQEVRGVGVSDGATTVQATSFRGAGVSRLSSVVARKSSQSRVAR